MESQLEVMCCTTRSHLKLVERFGTVKQIGLSVIIACILVPLILIQNAILFFKRKNEQLEQKIKPLCQVYLVLNFLCLIYWLSFQFLK